MFKKSMPLNLQIIYMLLLLLLLPLLAVGIFLYTDITSDLQSIEEERLSNYSFSSGEMLGQTAESTLNLAKSYSYWEEFRANLKSGHKDWVEENVLSVPDVISTVHFAAIADLNGKILMETRSAEGFTGAIDPMLVQKFKETPDFYAIVPSGDKAALIGVSQINNEKASAAPEGMLIFGRYVDETVLSDIHRVLFSDVAVMTSSGAYAGFGDSSSEQKLRPHIAKLTDDYKSFQITSDGKQGRAEMVTSLKGLGGQPLGAIYVSLPLEATSKIKDGLMITYFAVGLLLLLTLVIFTVWLRQRVVKPLQHVSGVLEETAKGVLTARINPVYEYRGDEIGLLANSFERMRESFRKVAAGVHTLAAALSGSSDQLAHSAEDSRLSGERMKRSVAEMAAGAEAQLQSNRESAKSMQEMAIGISRIAESAGAITEMSVQTRTLAREGNGSVRNTAEGMASIAGSVESSALTIQRLHEHTQNIGEIVEMVSTIAQQTNLLALNAAIEAARAGEAGRGFAVVAGEIRKLAEQSAASIGQITELLDSIRSEAGRSVEAMSQVSADVERGTEAMSELSKMFSEIQGSMERVSSQIEETSAVAEQLSAGSQEVSATVDEMAGISVNTAQHSQEVLRFAEGQSEVTARISNSMKELTLLAQQLQKLVEHMKV